MKKWSIVYRLLTVCLVLSATSCGGGSGNKPGQFDDLEYIPSSDFREESIYSIITTRFNNGDTSNDYYNRDRLELGDPTWRGDFKGIIDRLDYIHEDLGFTTIQLSPVTVSRGGLDYAGEYPYDMTMVDPRLESTGATLRDLVVAAHSKGIRVILSVVINHSSSYGIRGKVFNNHAPVKYFKKIAPFPSSDVNYPYKIHLGDYLSANREDDDNPLAPAIFRANDPSGTINIVCPRCGVTILSSGFGGYQNHDPNHFLNIDATTLNATWYHQNGFIAGGDWENYSALTTKHIAGDCIDLNTENTAVKTYIIDAYKKFIDMGVDGFHITHVKHMTRTNLLEYVNAWKTYKPSFFVYGENLVKGTGWGMSIDSFDNAPAEIRPWWYTRTTTDSTGSGTDDSGFAVMDYSLFSVFRDNISMGKFSGLSEIFAKDSLYGNATSLVTFIDNQNVGPQNDWKFRFSGTDVALASGLNLLWTARGIPSLFYGTEIRFKSGAEVDGSDAPHSTSGRAYFGDNLTVANITTTRSNRFVKHIKRLNMIRASCPALQKGKLEKVTDNENMISFVRNYNEGESYAVIGLVQNAVTNVSVTGVKGGKYIDAVTGASLTVAEGGMISFSVQPGSAGIYILNGAGKIGVDGDYLK